jgi:molecular chaperone GrpE
MRDESHREDVAETADTETADAAGPGETIDAVDDGGAAASGHEITEPAGDRDPEEELGDLRDRHLRLAAEFDNYRRRTRRELLERGEASRAGLARKLLEIVDDLQRVADTPCDPELHEAMHEGVGLIARKLLKSLSDEGVEPLSPLGERFDPNYHEAVLLATTDDPELDEVVSQVLLTGYRLGDRLLRAAQVIVYRHEEEDGEQGA